MTIRLPLLPDQLLVVPDARDGARPVEERREEELMQVGDLAREAGKTVRAIHLYEELGLLTPAARSKGRYRLYGPEALIRIRWIGKLQEMGFSLSDIQTIVREWEQLRAAPHAMKHARGLRAASSRRRASSIGGSRRSSTSSK